MAYSGWTKSNIERFERIERVKGVAAFAINGMKNFNVYPEYKLACEWMVKVNKQIDIWLTEHKTDPRLASAADQIFRSAYSVPLNIAEGIGKGQNYTLTNYTYAQGSLYEALTALKTAPFPCQPELIDDCLKIGLLMSNTINKLAVEALEREGQSEEVLKDLRK